MDDRAKKAEAWHRNAAVRAQNTKPSPPITCATFAQDVLEGRAQASQAHDHKHQPLIFGPQSLVNGSFTNERERMAAQVFQPSHRYIFIPFINKMHIFLATERLWNREI
jgi:immunoglobulin-binding protein 1